MISKQAALIEATLKLIHFRAIFKWMTLHPPRSKKGTVPKSISGKFKVTSKEVNDKEVATLEPNNCTANIHILFLHGGAYVLENSFLHWSFLGKLLDKLSCRISVVDYPLAPEYNYQETFEMVTKAYATLLELYPQDKFIFMGDSAGGGLAMAFTQKIIAEHILPIPTKLILLSPWLDIAMENPEIKALAEADKMLSMEVLSYCATKYAAGSDKHLPLLSPLFGQLVGLPDTIVFYGTHELLFPDCKRLRTWAEAKGARMKFYEYEGMQHDWLIFPIPEAEQGIAEISQFIWNGLS
jgi:acetyl esterase/lipase